jgi:GNAT superfamily N-acetyltransferase
MSVREATLDDAPELARLMGELGYPTDAGAMRGRLQVILADPGYATYVVDGPDRLLGVIGVMTGRQYNHDADYARIVVLVVDAAGRGRGTGAELVAAAVEWARSRGAGSIHVTTASHRIRTHEFYRRVGFEQTGLRFHQKLG